MNKFFLISLLSISIVSFSQNVSRKQVNGMPYIFADDYGVSKDFNTTTGSISSSSNSLTVASATGYVAGQYVYVTGAQFGGKPNNNISKITSISGTTITTQDNAGATVTSVIVAHDDTRAIQAAINAAKSSKGGTVFLRNGRYPLRDTLIQYGLGGVYINAQLYIPNTTTSDTAINITILGESEPNWEHSVLVDWPINNKGVVLESTVVPTTPGQPALLATEYGSTAFGNWNMTDVTLRNLTLRCRSKTDAGVDTANKMTAINFQTQSICSMENVRVDISSKLVSSTFQGFQGSIGIMLPARGNAAWNSLKNIFIGGYDVGLLFNEHTFADNITIAACFRGMKSADMDHSFHFGRILFNGCATNYFVEGNSYGDISNFATEHFTNTAGFGTKWYAFTEDILQTAGTPKIAIKYHVVTSAVGVDNGNWYLHSTGGTSSGIVANPFDATGSYSLPTASTTTLGGVKVDGTTITINGSGVISSAASGSGTPAGSNTQIQYNNSGAFGASANFTWNAGTLKNYSSSGGAVLEMKHPSATYPWQVVQGYDDADDWAWVRNGTKIFKINSSGNVFIPALANLTPQMLTVGGSGVIGSSIIPVTANATGGSRIAYGNGAGQVDGNSNFTWNGAALKLYSSSLGSEIDMMHASNTNPWKIIQGYSVVDDWTILSGATPTKRFQIGSTGTITIPSLGGSGSGYVAVDNSGNLSFSAGGTGGAGLTVGSSTISGGTSGKVLFDNSGVLNEYSVSGGGSVAMTISPTLTTPVISSITNSGTLTMPTVTGTLMQYSEASTASNATWAPAGDARENYYDITAQAAAVTAINAPTGTPANHNALLIRVKDNGTAQAIGGWNAVYRAGTNLAFPTTTTLSKTMYIKFIYNSADSKWDLISVLDGL